MEKDEVERLERLRLIAREVRVEGGSVCLPRTVLTDLFLQVFGDLVDEDWYLQRYPDVADAVSRGLVETAALHYAQAGIYEGRMPYRVRLDNADYLENHSDVRASIRDGAFRSALDHFVQVGFGEGRTFQLAAEETAGDTAEGAGMS